jgi:hypothetical protein
MPVTESGKDHRIQTTIRLPPSVYKRAKSLIEEPGSEIGTFNDLVVEALQAFVRSARRRKIDDAFAMMSADAGYQQEARRIAEEFEQSDWEALAPAGKQ